MRTEERYARQGRFSTEDGASNRPLRRSTSAPTLPLPTRGIGFVDAAERSRPHPPVRIFGVYSFGRLDRGGGGGKDRKAGGARARHAGQFAMRLAAQRQKHVGNDGCQGDRRAFKIVRLAQEK